MDLILVYGHHQSVQANTQKQVYAQTHTQRATMQADCAPSQRSINQLIYNSGKTSLGSLFSTQIYHRKQLEAINLLKKSNVLGLATQKYLF